MLTLELQLCQPLAQSLSWDLAEQPQSHLRDTVTSVFVPVNGLKPV